MPYITYIRHYWSDVPLQVCSNGTRVYVERPIYDIFLERLLSRVEGMVIGDPMHDDTTMGAIISPDQAQRIMSYIDGAKQEVTRQSEMADLARRATSVCTKFHRDRLRNGWDITLWNFAKTRTNTQTDRQTDMGITIPRPPPMGGEVTTLFQWNALLVIKMNNIQEWNQCYLPRWFCTTIGVILVCFISSFILVWDHLQFLPF